MQKRAVCTAVAVLTLPVALNVAPAQADPLPAFCVPSSVVDGVCTARLSSVTADVVNGTITGAPVGGGTAITLAGQLDAYQKSAGFEDVPPEPVQRWDAEIDSVSNLSVDPSDPNWYANAKSRVFMPRTLNDIATQFPPNVLVVRFTPDDAAPGSFRLVSIQPTALR
jgi:hypothetical protein